MKTKLAGCNMRSAWKTLSLLAGCTALAVALVMGSQANRAAAQSPAPAAQTPATAATPQSAPAAATDISGIWQATIAMPNGQMTRAVIKVTKDASGTYAASLFNADRGGRRSSSTP
jgi:uncharacterized membrane-anchored protein